MLVWPNKCFYFFLPKYNMFVCVIIACYVYAPVYAKPGVHARDRHFTQIWYETFFKKLIKFRLSQLLDKRLSLLRNI